MNIRKSFLLGFLIGAFLISNSIIGQDKEPPKSPKSMASLTIGIDTEVTFNYSSPSVKGRVIWGELIPWGAMKGNKYSDEKPFPWRGGANKNTTIEFNKDLTVAGTLIKAGKYSMHFTTGEKEWTVMINSVNDAWGSYKYDASKDVASFKVAPVEAPHQEMLRYGFEDYKGYSATAFLHWEKVKIPFNIEAVK